MTINKKLGLTFGILIILISSGIAYSKYRENQPRSNPTSAPLETTNPNISVGTTPVTTPVITPTKSPTPVTTAGTYTLAQIATHNTQASCWTTINGSVYNVTTWINQHPGGAQAILGLCGIDGSGAFNGQHGGQRRPASELASFKIGTLVQ